MFYELLELLWLLCVEVLCGVNGFECGVFVLGGVIDYVSCSGCDLVGVQLYYEVGSCGYQKCGFSWGGVSGDVDYFLIYIDIEFDGYQCYVCGDGKGVMVNIGWQIMFVLQMCFFVCYCEINYEMFGCLICDQICNDLYVVNVVNLVINVCCLQLGSIWVGNVIMLQFDEDFLLQVGLVYYIYLMDLNESLYWQQLDYVNFNVMLDYCCCYRLFGLDSEIMVGLCVIYDLDVDVCELLCFVSNGYVVGMCMCDFCYYGIDSILYVSNIFVFNNCLCMQVGLVLINICCDVQVIWLSSGGCLCDCDWDYVSWLGFIWQYSVQMQWFGNFSCLVEVLYLWLMIWGLNQYFGLGNGLFIGCQCVLVLMQNQIVIMLELGVCGDVVLGCWELIGYYVYVNYELFSVELQLVLNLFIVENNVSFIVYRGIEVGLDSMLWQVVLGCLLFCQVYIFSDFCYCYDVCFGSNCLFGLLCYIYQVELCFDYVFGLYVVFNIEYVLCIVVDYVNSYWVDSYVIFGSCIGYDVFGGCWQVWVEMCNIGNCYYVVIVMLGYDDVGRDVVCLILGEGCGVYVGVCWCFD